MNEDTTATPTNTGKSENNTKDRFGIIPYIIAIGVMVSYGFFIHYLVGRTDAEEPNWSRLIYLFSGVEAIVFAAAGFLFGREVNRKRAENAEEEKKQADKQKQEAEKQTVEERKKALILGAMAIQAEHDGTNSAASGSALEMTMANNPLESIAAKAKRMYPELNE